MSPFLSAFSVSVAAVKAVLTYAPAAVPSNEPVPAHPGVGVPTRAEVFQVGDRVCFFGGRHGQGAQLYTLTARSWMVNHGAQGGAGWYYRARATTSAGQLSAEECRWIGEEFVAWARL